MKKELSDNNPSYYSLFLILGMFSYWGVILYLISMKSKGVYIVSDIGTFNFKMGIGCAILGKIFEILFNKLEEINYLFLKNIIGCFCNLNAGIVVAAAFSIFMFIIPSGGKA